MESAIFFAITVTAIIRISTIQVMAMDWTIIYNTDTWKNKFICP